MFELVEEAQADRVKELEQLIAKARVAYDVGQPIVEDGVYDAWWDELKLLKADSPEIKAIGATGISEWVKVSHGVPMGSLDKVNLPEELAKWAIGLGLPGPVLQLFLWTEKLDGISIRLQYENGKFLLGATRGDGASGEDITPNVRQMKGLVQEIPGFSGSIRGEVVLFKNDFATHFPDKANTRNTAAGVSKRYDGKGCEHLTILAYSVLEGDMIEATTHSYETEFAQFEWLRAQGFKVPNYGVASGVGDINKVWEQYQESIRDSLDYDIDGLVIRINRLDLQYGFGDKDGRPLGAVAFKFAPITRVTILRAVEWQVGASGRITPVAVVDPVNLLGATIDHASLYNVAFIRKHRLEIGCQVILARGGDVIPKILGRVDG